MSAELYVFMHEVEVPSRDEWQEAINKAGFPTVLEDALSLRCAAGYCDATYKGEAASFELNIMPAEPIVHRHDSIERPLEGRDTCVTFHWSDDMGSQGAALSSAAALTKAIDGICYDPDMDLIYTGNDAVLEFKKLLEK